MLIRTWRWLGGSVPEGTGTWWQYPPVYPDGAGPIPSDESSDDETLPPSGWWGGADSGKS